MQANLAQLQSTAREAVFSQQLNQAASLKNSSQKLDEVAKDFESVFLNYYLGQMFEGVGKEDPIFGESNAMSIWRTMLTEEYGKRISEAGGLGIAKMVKNQLERYVQAQQLQAPAPTTEAIDG